MPETLNHYASSGFWQYYRKLPEKIQDQAKKQFDILKENPHHPSLRFQPKSGSPYWAARVTRGTYRAMARYQGNGDYLWVWIGTHREYEKLLSGK